MDKKCTMEDLTNFKFRTDKFYKLIEDLPYFFTRVEKMKSCGDYIALDEEGKIAQASFCRLRFCPMCQRRRSLRMFSDVIQIFELLKPKNYQYLHLILTVPNVSGENLSKTIDKILLSSSRLWCKRTDKHIKSLLFDEKLLKNREKVARAFKGVLRCLEVSYNENTNSFHPHLHCLVAVNKSYFSGRSYIKTEEISSIWASLNKVPFAICHIRKVDNSGAAVAEIAKYCVKPFEATETARAAEALQTIFSNLHNRRLVQTYGVIKQAARKLCEGGPGEDVLDESDGLSLEKYLWDGNSYILLEE